MQEMNRGFGDGLAQAFEFVITPIIFAAGGLAIDARLGTGLAFAIAFGLIVFLYEFWKVVQRYDAEMAQHQAASPWAKRAEQPQRSSS